jgi:hypothetical protein
MAQRLSRTGVQWILIFLSMGILVYLAVDYRAARVREIQTLRSEIANLKQEALRSENANLKQDIRRLDEARIQSEARSENANLKQDTRRADESKIQSAESSTVESRRSETLSSAVDRLDRTIRQIEESRLPTEVLKDEYLTLLRRRLSALDGLGPMNRGSTVLDLDREEDASLNLVPIVAMFDQTSLYSKGDRIEIYGASLRQARSGPILIKESTLNVEQQRAVVAWWPRHSKVNQATHVRIKLSESNQDELGTISLILKLKNEKTFKFAAKLGDRSPVIPAPLNPNLVPSDISRLLDEVKSPRVMVRAGREFLIELPLEALVLIAKLGDDAISVMALDVEAAAGTDISLLEVSLARPRFSSHETVTLFGKVAASSQFTGGIISLVGIDGTVRTAKILASNSFTFRDLRKGQPVSLRFKTEDQDYFADQGRWIVPEDDMTVAVHVEPLYLNNDNHKSNPSDQEFHFYESSIDNPGSSLYRPHSRQRWNGNTNIQQYDSFTFTNNWGYIDRDRFLDNADRCYRIVHLGSSHAVSLQVPVAQKYNFLLEEELGLKLNRCVEVLSAGRDNGDIGANYPSIRNYAVRFNPDIVIIEIQAPLLMQLDPVLSRKMLGWDPEKSVIGRVVYGADGRMKFQPPNPNAGLFTIPTDQQQYIPGVAFFDTIKVEWDKLPEAAKKAYHQLVDIVKFYRKTFPGIRFVLQDGADQAQCGWFSSCTDRVVTAADGTKFAVGLDTYLANLKRVCRDNALECISLPHYRYETDPKLPLIFTLDGHYNIRGHQWLARELTTQIFANFSNAKQTIPPSVHRQPRR